MNSTAVVVLRIGWDAFVGYECYSRTGYLVNSPGIGRLYCFWCTLKVEVEVDADYSTYDKDKLQREIDIFVSGCYCFMRIRSHVSIRMYVSMRCKKWCKSMLSWCWGYQCQIQLRKRCKITPVVLKIFRVDHTRNNNVIKLNFK